MRTKSPLARVFFLAFSIVFTLLVLAGFNKNVRGQTLRQYKDFDRYRYVPRLPEQTEDPQPLPDVPQDVTGDTTPLIGELKALIFVDDPDAVMERSGDERGVVVESSYGLWLLRSPAFQELAAAQLGRAISVRDLNELVRETILFYRRNDQPVVDVSIPEQEITSGVVQVVVTEARVGQVRVEGARYFNPEVLVRQVFISPGDPIYESFVTEDVRWLFRNPYRRVDLEFTPGDSRGLTDVVFRVEDKLPVRVYAGYEDTGTRFTGLERTFYGINWLNALGRDDQAGYQYTASSDFASLSAHSAYYSTALLNRDIVTIYGSYAESRSRLPEPFDENQGIAWQVLTRWYRELCPRGCYEHGITAGFDFKRQTSNLEFGGIAVFDTPVDIVQFMFGYNAKSVDAYGSWAFGIDTYISPGHLSNRNNNRTFQQVRAFAEADYIYARGFAERRTHLPHCFESVIRFTGQVSDTNLISFEQLGFGGYNSIRGYDMYTDVTDSGYFLNLELWSPTYHLGVGDDELRFLSFFDVGNGYNHTLLPGERPSIGLSSLGAGLRYVCRPNLELRADYAWQLGDDYVFEPRQRWHIGCVLSH